MNNDTWVVFTLYPQLPQRCAQTIRPKSKRKGEREQIDTQIICGSLNQSKVSNTRSPRKKKGLLPRNNSCQRLLPSNPSTQPHATPHVRGCIEESHVRAWGAANKNKANCVMVPRAQQGLTPWRGDL
jgi:hypothetical protein